MTVLLVLFTLILFLVTDYFIQKARSSAAHAVRDARRPSQELLDPWHPFPDDATLALNHTWVRRGNDGTATIGLDEFLGRLVGTLESIVLPEVGTLVAPATANIALHQGGNMMALSSPLLGRVTDVNPDVVKDPSLFRRDPYGEGWLMKIEPSAGHETMSGRFLVAKPAEWLRQQTESAKDFFRAFIPHGQPGLMQDGGIPADGLLQHCDAEVWRAFRDSFAVLDHTHSPVSDRRESHGKDQSVAH